MFWWENVFWTKIRFWSKTTFYSFDRKMCFVVLMRKCVFMVLSFFVSDKMILDLNL